MSNLKVKNQEYISKLKAQIKQVVPYVAAAVSNDLYRRVMEETAADSGQAMAQWYMATYTGSYSMNDQEVLWGYGDVEPVYPVGYKGDKGESAAEVITAMLENYTLNEETVASREFDGVVIYNPISAGFPGFHPGSDMYYEDNAFGWMQSVSETLFDESLRLGYTKAAAKFSFLST